MKVYFDEQWVIERDNGDTVRLTWNESSLLYHMIRRKTIWDEVEMRLDEDECYAEHREEIEAVKDDIIDSIMSDEDITGDVVYEAIENLVDLDNYECPYPDDTIISINIRKED